MIVLKVLKFIYPAYRFSSDAFIKFQNSNSFQNSNPFQSLSRFIHTHTKHAHSPSSPFSSRVLAKIRQNNSHEKGDYTVRKVFDDSVSVGDRKFTLDDVLDSKSSQGTEWVCCGRSPNRERCCGCCPPLPPFCQGGIVEKMLGELNGGVACLVGAVRTSTPGALIGVRGCHNDGKRTAETLAMDYHRGAGVEGRIARIFNTYGPRMCLDDGRVVSNFVSQAIRKQPVTVYGDGKQTRSFQYVSDLVDGLMALMEGEHIGPFNLGNPREFTMLELAQVVKETIDSSATVEFRDNTADDPQKWKPDISKAKELLNWEPKVPLREGLPKMASDFRNRILHEDEIRKLKI